MSGQTIDSSALCTPSTGVNLWGSSPLYIEPEYRTGWNNRVSSASRTTGGDALQSGEPPFADPHVRWCGEGELITPPLPDSTIWG